MPNNNEVFEDGQCAFFSAREVAWHKLGTVTPDCLTAEDAARVALLAGWNVRRLPMYVGVSDTSSNYSGLIVPDRDAIVRTNPVNGGIDVLGVVGNRYQIVQNEEAFAILDAIVDESGAHFETAGSLDGGRRVFMSMKMPQGIQVGGEDAHDVYLIATDSKDGSSAFTLAVTPVRVVCKNTLTMGLARAKQTWTLRHTSNIQGRIQEARESLKLTVGYMDAFQAELTEMLDREVSNATFDSIVKELLPVNEDSAEGWRERTQAQHAVLNTLYRDASTNEFGRGTAYAAYNALTEYADWYMPIRGADVDGTRRAERAMTATNVQAFKNKGLALVRSA